MEIILYTSESLAQTSDDGKSLKTHMNRDLKVHRYLMGAQFDDQTFEEDEEKDMPVFVNLGRFEKKIGLSMHDETEIYIVNQAIDEDEWICFDDFVIRNGGLLNIPLFFHTDAPLFIIRHWGKMIL